jgi:hypothetical protein
MFTHQSPAMPSRLLAAVRVHHRESLAGDDDQLLLLELLVGHDRVDDVGEVLPGRRARADRRVGMGVS